MHQFVLVYAIWDCLMGVYIRLYENYWMGVCIGLYWNYLKLLMDDG